MSFCVVLVFFLFPLWLFSSEISRLRWCLVLADKTSFCVALVLFSSYSNTSFVRASFRSAGTEGCFFLIYVCTFRINPSWLNRCSCRKDDKTHCGKLIPIKTVALLTLPGRSSYSFKHQAAQRWLPQMLNFRFGPHRQVARQCPSRRCHHRRSERKPHAR